MRKDKEDRQADKGDVDGDLLDPEHHFDGLGLIFMEYLAYTREDCLGKRSQGECLAGIGDPFGDRIKSGDSIVGEDAENKYARRGVGVDRGDRDKNIPACRQLLPDSMIPFKLKRYPEFPEDDILAQEPGH